jgi:predicted NBD/HSP70 family sugar kinase
LAVRHLVPDGQADGSRTANPDSEGGGASSSRRRARHPPQESSLVTQRLASKRRRLEEKGYSSEAVALAAGSVAEKRTLRSYSLVQTRYVNWALQRDLDPETPSPTNLANWLASGVANFK